jgi:TPR repeat protein
VSGLARFAATSEVVVNATPATFVGEIRRAMLAASFVLLALSGFSAAGPLEGADAAYKRGNYATALQLFRPLAEKGNASAQSALGFMYEYAQGVPQDYIAAEKWHRLAAEQGNALSQTRLGFIYQFGNGVPQNYAEAANWFRRAADQGRAVAQVVLGQMYYGGRGVPKDFIAAYMWLSLAAAQGDYDAARTLDQVAKFMTDEQVSEAQKLAHDWQPKPHR